MSRASASKHYLRCRWEGFAHIALHCWTEKQQLRDSQFVEFKGKVETSLFAIVLHVAIRLHSDSDPVFRKACMVAAKLPSSSTCTTTHLKALQSSQRSTFDEILRKIDQNCSIKEALKRITLAVKEGEDEAFQWMSWLRHLPQQGVDRIDFCNIFGALEELLEAFNSNPDHAMADFTAFKSGFCQRVVYEDVCESFETLLEMYRTTRTRYMRGMLALHGAGAHVS
jgi:lysine-specific demethylase/histidyl-hydroxylase NO66